MDRDAGRTTPGPLGLIAMPWSHVARPSAAIAALAAYVRRERPAASVHCHYAYLEIAEQLGVASYQAIAEHCYNLGELLYMPLLYPDKAANARAQFGRLAATQLSAPSPDFMGPALASWEAAFDHILRILDAHVQALALRVARACDVVGLTTCFGQLFANLALAQRLKQHAPHLTVILGGSTISGPVGPSLLREYPWVDYIIQGEGEQPLVALLATLQTAETSTHPPAGVLTRATAAQQPDGVPLSEVHHMDTLPIPSYDEYAEAAEAMGLDWQLPIEGSRGCWWDRARRTANPRNTCYFCNLNVQWQGYREKTVPRLVAELKALSERYTNLDIYFLDNILRHHGIADLASAIGALGKDFSIFYEVRAHLSPFALLLLWEAGLTQVQFGIEGLSAGLLKRIGKGTSVIQNLQAMKTCKELGITHGSNLLINFPGATPDEVTETAQNIMQYALSFEPCSLTHFTLGQGSTVETLRDHFGITNVRNREWFRAGLPEEVWRRLRLLDVEYDDTSSPADWSSVVAACDRWRDIYTQSTAPLLFYQDGGSFLRIQDSRGPAFRTGTFTGMEREIYLFCSEIRSFMAIVQQFAHAYHVSPATIQTVLGGFLQDHLMFAEQHKYLSLAVAPSPQAAARRIRATGQRPEPARSTPHVVLPILGE
jgi:ribosomal peptide maturation radical SAM protein 1